MVSSGRQRSGVGVLGVIALLCVPGSVFAEEPMLAGGNKLDRQELNNAIQGAAAERQFWDGRAAHCGQALELLRQTRSKVWPGSREELDYVIYKTENFITVL